MISHSRRDHFDVPSLKFLQLKYDPIMLVPQGLSKLCHKIGFNHVVELTWWKQYNYSQDLTFTLLPAKHCLIEDSSISIKHYVAVG